MDRPAAANCLLSSLESSFGSILDKVKLCSTLEIWQVKEISLKSASIALGGLCFRIGLTAADLNGLLRYLDSLRTKSNINRIMTTYLHFHFVISSYLCREKLFIH